MKRFLALALVAVVMCSLFCACGNKKSSTVKTTVAAEYDDGFAKKYAKTTSTDSNGNTVYEFTGDQYDKFTYDYNNHLSAELGPKLVAQHNGNSTGDQKPYGQYVYIKEEKKAVLVGISADEYNAEQAQAEADIAAEYGFKYFQNLKKPVNKIKVIFCNAGNQDEVFGSFDYSIN